MLIRLRKDAEEGVVLVTVLLLTMIMLIIVAGTMAYAVGSQNVSRRDQDWNAALSAAEAGLDDYLFRLNENDQYYLYNATHRAARRQPGVHHVGVGARLGRRRASRAPRARTPTSRASGTRSTPPTSSPRARSSSRRPGRSRGVTRTIQATLRRKAFIDYLYFTDYETKDPAAYDSDDDYTPAEAQTYCAMRYYEGRDIAGRVDFVGDTDGNSCTEISFASARHGQRTAALERRDPDLRRPDVQRQRHDELEPGHREQVGRTRRELRLDPVFSRPATRSTPIR